LTVPTALFSFPHFGCGSPAAAFSSLNHSTRRESGGPAPALTLSVAAPEGAAKLDRFFFFKACAAPRTYLESGDQFGEVVPVVSS
jgi:hypothetical protein